MDFGEGLDVRAAALRAERANAHACIDIRGEPSFCSCVSTITMKRKVLVILSNRFAPSRDPRYLELVCKPDGTILQERRLRRAPRRAIYDEVWRNNDGKQSLDSCTRISRLYRHPLEKPKR